MKHKRLRVGTRSASAIRLPGIMLFIFLCLGFSPYAYAACTDPAGVAGEIIFNGNQNVPQVCADTEWVALGVLNPAAGGDGCSDPEGVAGDIIYNGNIHAPQYCDGDDWRVMIGGGGGAAIENTYMTVLWDVQANPTAATCTAANCEPGDVSLGCATGEYSRGWNDQTMWEVAPGSPTGWPSAGSAGQVNLGSGCMRTHSNPTSHDFNSVACWRTCARYEGALSARIQFKNSLIGNPSTATFDVAPTEGNLLVVIAGHRSNSGAHSISGSGWASHINLIAHDGNSNSRRGLAVWSKIAGASEPQTISVNFGAADSRITIMEFAIDDASVAFDTYAQTAGGTGNVTFISTGTTPTSATAQSLVITGLVARDELGSEPAWTNDIDGNVGVNGSISLHSGYTIYDTQGTRESTANWIGARQASAGVVVFSITPD